MQITLDIALLIILLFLAALTAASEISLIAVSRLRLKKLASDGSKSAKIILKIMETPGRFFSTILVANDVVGALIAVLVTTIVIRFIGENRWELAIATTIASLLIIISEVSAKTFAARYSERMSSILARPVEVLIAIFSPLVKILERATEAIIKLMGGGPPKQSLVSEEEIRAIIKIGQEEGILHKDKYMMLSRVFDFGEVTVQNIMTPKENMIAIDINSKIEDVMDKVLETGYSRLPAYKGDLNNIVGIVNMKDLLNLAVNRELLVLQDVVYSPLLIPSSKKVIELLKEFQKGHAHIAIVVDSKGKTEGLVTLEDILEEIVGEIEDEYDVRYK